jgi:hypothetical protein
MKTKQQILDAVKGGKESQCMDGRDFSRLADFYEKSDWGLFGFDPETEGDFKREELTESNVLVKLESDLDFAFEKALGRRCISSSFMYEVIKMWMWVLDDELQDFDSYAMYGLPLYKAVALKYGFPNQIGDDDGWEDKY